MAESLADLMEDDVLKYKIYEKMALYNGNAGEHEIAIKYDRKALKIANEIRNNDYITCAFLGLATSYMWLGRLDSARLYIGKCMEHMEYLRPQGFAYAYDVIGEVYKNENKKYAETYLKKAIELYPLPWTYKKLAELYLEKGDEDKANEVWEKALAFDADKIVAGFEAKINIYEAMREQKRQYGRYAEADSIAGLIITLKDSMRAQQDGLAVRDMQMEYDEQMEDEAAEDVRTRLAWGLGTAVLLALAATAVYLRVHRRDRRLISIGAEKTMEYEQRITALADDKKEAETKLRKAETKMRKAEREAQARITRQAEIISAGRTLAQTLDGGGSTVRWSKDDYRKAMEFYRTVDGGFVARLETDYDGLSPRNMLFATLRHLGKTDDDLMRALGVSASALRVMKMRMEKKRKGT